MTTGCKLLIVEDNPQLAENLFEYLEPKGYVLDHAPDGITGLHLAVSHDYDVIVLDVMLPKVTGLEICRRMRQDADKRVPVLMLTARDQLSDKLEGFGAGADDYLVKPFDLPELDARLQALIARNMPALNTLQVGALNFDLGQRRISIDGQPVQLNRTSERVLEVLMRAYPNAVTRADLEFAVWGDSPPESDTLRTHVHAIRKAIDEGAKHKMLRTIHRYGYQLIAESRQ